MAGLGLATHALPLPSAASRQRGVDLWSDMTAIDRIVPRALRDLYDVREWRNGLAILSAARPEEWADIVAVLLEFRLLHSEIATPGGRKSKIANRLDNAFKARGWKERRFDTRIVVDGAETKSPTHEVDVLRAASRSRSSGTTRTPFSTAI
jgi:hypothetical protein